MGRGAVLVADDDSRVALGVTRVLLNAGFAADFVNDGRAALQRLTAASGVPYMAAVMDVNMPYMTGLEVLVGLRAAGNEIPVLLLTDLNGEVDTVLGFRAGADDYLGKPFRPAELVVRLERLVKPRQGAGGPVVLGDAVFSLEDHTVAGSAGSCGLSGTEVELLRPLLTPPGRVVQRNELLVAGWRSSSERNVRSLYEHIRRIRGRLAELGTGVDIINVRNVGYKVVQVD